MVSIKILKTFPTEAGGSVSNLGRALFLFLFLFPGSHRTLPKSAEQNVSEESLMRETRFESSEPNEFLQSPSGMREITRDLCASQRGTVKPAHLS